jgi:hypothetical protein
MGYIRDQEGIINRYLRESANWESHLQKTREFIQNSCQDPKIESVAVLGSGWLLDVPLEALIKRFKRVYLVDIHHPVQIRKKTSSLRNVQLVEADLSGGVIEQLWKLSRHKSPPDPGQLLELLSFSHPLSHIHPDAVISVNLLNQLDIILCDFLAKHGYFQQESPLLFRAAIQNFHLKWITESPGCLISDVMELNEDKKGIISSKSLLHTQLPRGIRRDQWRWDFDSRGTYHSETLTHMEVRAIEWA